MDVFKIWKNINGRLDVFLDRHLPSESEEPKILHSAMRYIIFSGGKRFRPLLVFLGYYLEKMDFENEDLYYLSSAIELIHNFSLVHDDLPSLDNDDYRRGKPTIHKLFGEGIAVLVGDALFAYAFKFLNKIDSAIVEVVIDALLSRGMIGGQVIDIQKQLNSLEEVLNLHYCKTGRLIEASLLSGYMLANGKKLESVKKIGYYLGLMFQMKDDILDENKGEEITILKFLDKGSVISKLDEMKSKIDVIVDSEFSKTGSYILQLVDFLINRNE